MTRAHTVDLTDLLQSAPARTPRTRGAAGARRDPNMRGVRMSFTDLRTLVTTPRHTGQGPRLRHEHVKKLVTHGEVEPKKEDLENQVVEHLLWRRRLATLL